jgi:hypothetical protein
LSLAQQDLVKRRPVPVVSLTRQQMREIEAMKDRIYAMCGTDEAAIEADIQEFPALNTRVTMQWRWPLTIAEVAQMAPTPEVRERKGRP